MGRSPLWSVPSAWVLHWREWDHEFVVYHQQSGDTHRLNSTGARVLRLLTQRPMTTDDVTANVAADMGPAEGSDPRAVAEELLNRLADLGLITSNHGNPPDAGAAGPR
jgi:PqqD family protein of HPr-rel-A system